MHIPRLRFFYLLLPERATRLYCIFLLQDQFCTVPHRFAYQGFTDTFVALQACLTRCRQDVIKTDGSVCSLKENSDGKFDLKIDGVSHVNWFRRKKYEFMEALGLPTKRQNRGIKL